ncbi:hypothetical protein [Methylobacterium radiotolerans]|uniref:hypothetical protein n=1 Tax=Methylobacterium radiotolerans TaxID=31998 RepID=UPI001F2D4FA6|nr:hypothetical protein [Methylobacterium radiotolerans]UIY45821.1 hypothetical protein LZ599_32460 [Methylobacterium radiotolerans]
MEITRQGVPVEGYIAARSITGRIVLYDGDVPLCDLPVDFPPEHVATVARAFRRGRDLGHVEGRIARTAELRSATAS